MNYYETLFIVHSALDSSRLKDIIVSVHDMMGGMNSKVYATDVWGKKKLSYLIDKQSYGTYVLVQFESDGLSNNKIAVELEHNPNILAYLTTKIEEEQLEKNIKSLDEQLSTSSSGGSEEQPSVKTSDSPENTKEVESSNESEDVEEAESSDESKDVEEAESSDESEDVKEAESNTDDESNNEKNEDENGTNEQ